MSRKSFPKKYEASYVFNDSICRLWPLINCQKNIEIIFREVSLSIPLNEEDNSDFSFSVVDMTSIECNKKVTWLISGRKSPTKISASFILVSNTLDDSTLLTVSLVLLKPCLEPSLHSKIVEATKQICVQLINNIGDLMQNNPVFQYEFESIEINAPVKVVWDFIISFEFLKVTQYKDFKANGDTSKLGTIISWTAINENGEEILFECKVSHCNHDENRKKWTYAIEAFNDKLKSQTVKFILIILGEEKTFFSFYHEVREIVEVEQLIDLSAQKKIHLQMLKEELEKKYLEKRGNSRGEFNGENICECIKTNTSV